MLSERSKERLNRLKKRLSENLWVLQIPIVLTFTFMFWVTEAGVHGNLNHPLLRESLYPKLRTVTGWFTNRKFLIRGETYTVRDPKSRPAPTQSRPKVVIVAVNDDALANPNNGRWPWHRDLTAKLIDNTFKLGARAVGLDIVFSERDPRVSDEARMTMQAAKIPNEMIDSFETDNMLVSVISKYKDRLVLGYSAPGVCQPLYQTSHQPDPTKDDCPVWFDGLFAKTDEQNRTYSVAYPKFAIKNKVIHADFRYDTTPLISPYVLLPNQTMFSDVAAHAGFLDAYPDGDGYIRQALQVFSIKGDFYPSLALEMASVVKGEELTVGVDAKGLIYDLSFAQSHQKIPVTPLGAMQINFRGRSESFDYVSADDVLQAYLPDETQPGALAVANRTPADETLQKKTHELRERLKDAAVFIGITAVGVYDMRAFPFDSNTAGVEGHATMLDNILWQDVLEFDAGKVGSTVLYILMIFGALAFAWGSERLEAVPALLLFIVSMTGLAWVDIKVLFQRYNQNWNTAFLSLELMTIFALTIAIKYVMEERNKKFIKGAFAKYVSPAIIDGIMEDPSKLKVGGEKRDLTILFSDIRGFTNFSETMDAPRLAKFLNEYLGLMTDIVFECDGTLDKYIGDAVMAFWGAPLNQPNHAQNACRAAIRMQQVLSEHYQRFKTEYGVEVAIGIGINSGGVNVGNMGSERIFEYTVIGDHVNLASRLEGLTKYYGVKIVTTRYTFDHIQGTSGTLPPHRTLDFVKVKGKKQAVELIEVLVCEVAPEGLALFEKARSHYSKKEWDAAIEYFEKSSKMLAPPGADTDPPSQMYIERCQEFKTTPPPADWTGDWEMHSK